jgi:hypothetical protein
VAEERSPGFERAEQLQITEVAPHGALLFRRERAGPRIGATRLEQQCAVRPQHSHSDCRVILEQCSPDATDGVVVVGAKCVFERGRSGGSEIAGGGIEALDFSGEQRALALCADGIARLAIVDVFQHEERRRDGDAREQGNEKKSRLEAVRSQRVLRRRIRCAREVPRLRRCIDQTLFALTLAQDDTRVAVVEP